MSRTGKFFIQIGIILLIALFAGFLAFVISAAASGIAMGVAPVFTFRQVEGWVCPEGTRLEYDSIQRSYHEPGESEPIVECVSVDGSRQDRLLQAILAVWGFTFLGVFLIIFFGVLIPVELILLVISRRQATKQPDSDPVT
jgi:hypothetical protein